MLPHHFSKCMDLILAQKVRSALVSDTRSMYLSKTENLEFEFSGTEGIQYQDFLQHIRRIAFSEGESRNFAWMADLAALHFSGDAFKWYESLDDDTQQDWNLLRKAVAKKYGSESDEARADGWSPNRTLKPRYHSQLTSTTSYGLLQFHRSDPRH